MIKKIFSVFLAVIMLAATFVLPFDVSAKTKRCEITSSNPTVIIRWSYTTGTVSKKGNGGTQNACVQKKGKNYMKIEINSEHKVSLYQAEQLKQHSKKYNG